MEQIKRADYVISFTCEMACGSEMSADRTYDRLNSVVREYLMYCVDRPFIRVDRRGNDVIVKTDSKVTLDRIVALV